MLVVILLAIAAERYRWCESRFQTPRLPVALTIMPHPYSSSMRKIMIIMVMMLMIMLMITSVFAAGLVQI